MVAVFNIEGANVGVLCMILAFLFVYQNTSAPVAWMYAAETTIDAGMGVCIATLFGTILLLSLTCPFLMQTASFGPNGMFLLFGGLSVLAVIYV